MKPSRLETMCRVTLRPFAFPSLGDIVPPRFGRDRYGRVAACPGSRAVRDPGFRSRITGIVCSPSQRGASVPSTLVSGERFGRNKSVGCAKAQVYRADKFPTVIIVLARVSKTTRPGAPVGG